MTLIRIRFRQLGGHVHCRVFTAPGPDRTFAKNGDLIFDERKWPDVREKLSRVCELLPEVTADPPDRSTVRGALEDLTEGGC
jgi:hypothetical protein